MSIAHDVRNWLHQMLLAAQAASPGVLANGFARAHPLHIRGPRDDHHWDDWSDWSDFVTTRLSPIRPGALYLRLVQKPEVSLDAVDSGEVGMRWQLSCRLRGAEEFRAELAFDATLVQENERWVAKTLSCRDL